MNSSLQSSTVSSEGIPLETFYKLYNTSDEILQSMFESARYDFGTFRFRLDPGIQDQNRDALDSVAEKVRRFFSAESCGIFLVNWKPSEDPKSKRAVPLWDKPETLNLVGTSNEVQRHSKFAREFKPTTSGLTLHLAHLVRQLAKPLILQESELTAWTSDHFEHLNEKKPSSLIATPLFNRKQQFIGYFKVENKRNSDHVQIPFSLPIDSLICDALAQKIVLVTETHHLLDSLREIMSSPPDNALQVILDKAVFLLHADAADFDLYNAKSDSLVCEHSLGTVNKTFASGKTVPTTGFIMDTWQGNVNVKPDSSIWKAKKNSRWTQNVHEYQRCGGSYHEHYEDTKSEIAVRFGPDSEPLGVLNVEAFKYKWFDDRDEEILQIMSQHASVAVQVLLAMEKEVATTRAYTQLVNRLPKTMIIQKDVESRIIFSNEAYRKYVGMTHEELIGRDDYLLFEPELAAKFIQKDKEVMFDDSKCKCETVAGVKVWYQQWEEINKLKGTSDECLMEVTKIRMTNASGKADGVQCIFWDVTHRKEDEEYRLREIHHRVLNNLNIVASYVERGQSAIEGAIQGVGLLHELMYIDKPSLIRMDTYIPRLVASLISLNSQGRDINVRYYLDDLVLMHWQKAQALCIILVELITNAIKHAFQGVDRHAQLSVSLRLRDNSAQLIVEDNGIGFRFNPNNRGWGIGLVRNWVNNYLHGIITANVQNGTRWVIDFENQEFQ